MAVLSRTRRLAKELTLFDVYVISLGPMLSSGFFLLPGLAAAKTGASVVLAYVLAGLLAFPAMLSKAELSTAMPRAGGTYYFLDRSLGPMVGTVGGLGTWLVLVLKSAFALLGMGAYLSLVAHLPIKTVAIGLTVVFALVNLFGARESGGLQRGLVLLVLGLLVVFLVGGATHLLSTPRVSLGGSLHPFLAHGPEGLVGTIGLVFVSFVGLTKAASVSEEVRNPDRNIPLGMFLALVSAIVIYGVGVSLIVAAVSPQDLYRDLTPVATAGEMFFRRLPRPLILTLVLVPALAGFASAGNAGILAASRYPLAMARDRLMPARFGELGRFRTPALAILCTAGLMVLCIVTLDVLSVAKLASAFQLLVFAMVNLAVIVMRESGLASYDPGFRSPLYPWIQILGLLAPFLLIDELGFLAIVFTLGLMAIALVWYFYFVRRRVQRAGAVMHWFERLGQQRFAGLDTELRGIMKEKGLREEDPFDHVVARAVVLDVERPVPFEEVARAAAGRLAEILHVPATRLADGFLRGTQTGATPVAHGAALPHVRVVEAEFPLMVLVRAREGGEVEVGDPFVEEHPHSERVFALFFLVSPEADPGQHLRLLAQIAGRVDDEDFMDAWLAAEGEQDLKEILLRDERFVSLRLERGSPTAPLIGTRLRDLEMPEGCLVALVRRRGRTRVPGGGTVLQEGDRLTVIGEPPGIAELLARYRDQAAGSAPATTGVTPERS